MAAAPAMGTAPSAPGSPGGDDDENTHNDSDVMNRELGISKDNAKKIAVDGEMIVSHRPLTNLPGQKFLASAPIFVQVQKVYPDGSADVKVMFSMCNKEKIKNLDGMSEYTGPVDDLQAHMSKGELDKIRLGGFEGAAGGAGGGAPPGGDPMGGGAPPGAPPGGPPGAPPPMPGAPGGM